MLSASDLIRAETGELPVILTAPHGGRQDVPGCALRTPTGSRFVTGTDHNTDLLTLEIAAEIKRLTGKQPYLVMARFHRKFIDANRRTEEAYGAAGCAAIYAEYHAAIRRFVDEVRAKYPHAMLFDIHGQAVYPDAVLRGTRHGIAVKQLLAREGSAAVTGVDSVFGRLAALGYAVMPSNDKAPDEKVEIRNYTGGHTVALYGSQRPDGIDTMQIEFGRNLRGNDVLEQTAKDTAQAIAAFYQRHLR